jgi:hypothetical protein
MIFASFVTESFYDSVQILTTHKLCKACGVKQALQHGIPGNERVRRNSIFRIDGKNTTSDKI